ncbi:MAG: hypothetical protein ABIK28_18355 [Planctomycetota bacterium]
MKKLIILPLMVVSWFAFTLHAAAGDEAESLRKLLDGKAKSIVNVSLVLKVKLSVMGQGQDVEREKEVSGVIVDETGLVMISTESLDPPPMFANNPQFEMTVAPLSMKVILPDKDEEMEAILAAKDTNLNLAFLQIKEVGDAELVPIRFAEAPKIQVGQEYVGINRHNKGFDYAAYFGKVRVTGQVFQPRPLFAVDNGFSGLGLPVFNMAGEATGVLTRQEGSEGAKSDSSGGGPFSMLFDMEPEAFGNAFLLPGETVCVVIEQAKEKAKEALKKQAEEAESESDEE